MYKGYASFSSIVLPYVHRTEAVAQYKQAIANFTRACEADQEHRDPPAYFISGRLWTQIVDSIRPAIREWAEELARNPPPPNLALEYLRKHFPAPIIPREYAAPPSPHP